MNDLKDLARKAHLVISVCFSIVISTTAYSQQKNIPEEYRVINDFFNGNKEVNLYDTSTYDKGWADYFVLADFKNIKKKADIPFKIDHDSLKKLLTNDVLQSIRRNILNSKPINLKSRHLNNNIALKKKYDTGKAIKNNVRRINFPIVVDDIAILKIPGIYECPIYILKNNGEKWQVVYTFYDWLILH